MPQQQHEQRRHQSHGTQNPKNPNAQKPADHQQNDAQQGSTISSHAVASTRPGARLLLGFLIIVAAELAVIIWLIWR